MSIGKKIEGYVGLLFLAVIFVFLASFSTSPLYPYCSQGDSAQFQTIGMGWTDGKILYRDLFDHKGPVIFWINMLGYVLNGESSGITFFQIICLFVTLVYLYKLCLEVCNKPKYGLIACMAGVCVLTSVYGDGNFTEEYCLPFLSMSTYYQYCYMMNYKTRSTKHNPLWGLCYGFTFGVCLLTRVTNAVAVCSGIVIICVMLVYKKEYRNLWKNVLGFMAGFSIITIPFIIYFAHYGVLGEFLYATIGYNMEYKAGMTSWLRGAGIQEWIKFGFWYFCAYSIFIVALLAFIRGKKLYAAYCVLCGLLECYLFLSGALYFQYAIITFPQFFLLINEIKEMKCEDKSGKRFQRVCAMSVILFCMVCIAKFSVRTIRNLEKYQEYQPVGYEQLLELVPESERDCFIAYGDNRMKGLYLLHDILPYYKYFVIQEWHASFSDIIKNDIHHTFEYGNVKWILSCGKTDTIQDVLDLRYQLMEQTGDYRLYKLENN